MKRMKPDIMWAVILPEDEENYAGTGVHPIDGRAAIYETRKQAREFAAQGNDCAYVRKVRISEIGP